MLPFWATLFVNFIDLQISEKDPNISSLTLPCETFLFKLFQWKNGIAWYIFFSFYDMYLIICVYANIMWQYVKWNCYFQSEAWEANVQNFIHVLYSYICIHTQTYIHMHTYTSRLITIFYKILQRYAKRKTLCSKAYPHIVIHVKNLTITLEVIFPSSWAKNKGWCPSVPVYSKREKVLVALQKFKLSFTKH